MKVARAVSEHSGLLNFLEAGGTVSKSISYADLYDIASVYARRLLTAGLTPSDIVLGGFTDHESQIYLFWACCLAGIPVCLLPALHPDPSQQANLFNHLQKIFHKPTLVAAAETIKEVHDIVPDLKTLIPEKLPVAVADTLNRVFPARQPSPTETVCFALTSGSTGSSKAVLLRHSNFLSNLRGKIRVQGTTADSRFLNWIASDHVACINEIHLHALALNASQWHISPEGISHNPSTLLKCLSKYRITYTFSPNFLLAAILRDFPHASFDEPLDLSNLQALISGGEAVPVETALAFANLLEKLGGRRVLQGAFGMAETVAGFIYDIRTTPKANIPGGPKYLSVGKCCQGAEVRVVKRDTGKLCPPGETGKLQIRGPTVFTEYYGNEHATAQSFTSDGWFTTGDLAQLDDDGNLYIVGRDKDFLNINGVKYPAQDVEHYIEDAGIQGVMHSYVCVCPMRLADADTETYGVFYQHEFAIEGDLNSAKKDAICAANRSIKAACTMFCSQVPHIVLPLPRKYFTKTALGKVSRSQLSQAYLVGEFDKIRAMLETQDNAKRDDVSDILVNPVPGVVAEIISTTFSVDISSLRRSQSVFDMGATSMHLLRMKQAMQERLSLPKLPTMEMLKRTQVGELCDYLTELVQAEKRGANKAAVEYDPIICMNPSGIKPPLFLIHPGVCDVLVFVALARELGDDRPVYALRARGFDNNETPFSTWNEMIECYTSSIERVNPNGPYYIAGYSYGGAMAFEIAKSLESKGKSVPFVGILNLPPYFQFFVPELNWAEVAFYLAQFLSIIPLSEVDHMLKEIQKAFPELTLNNIKPRNPRGPISWLFERLDEKRFMDLDLDVGAITTWVNVIFELRRIGRTYVPQGRVKNALMTVFCAVPLHMVRMGRQEYKDDKLSMWKEFSGPRFEMIDVDGEHGSMISEENIASFSAHMRAALRRAELGE